MFLIFIAHKPPKHHVSLRYVAPDRVLVGIVPDRVLVGIVPDHVSVGIVPDQGLKKFSLLKLKHYESIEFIGNTINDD